MPIYLSSPMVEVVDSISFFAHFFFAREPHVAGAPGGGETLVNTDETTREFVRAGLALGQFFCGRCQRCGG